ncbi:MAG: hypothetical protein ACTTKH_00540 [Treponema sp.]
MQGLSEAQRFILNQEFPDLNLSGDDDIERYFIFRKQGKEREALFLYNNKLKAKYPNENMRVALISAYRKKDPIFTLLLTQCLKALADRTIERTKGIINFISENLTKTSKTNILSIVSQCENVVSKISADRYQALPFTEKYSRYASYFNFKSKEMKKASNLIKLYISGEFSYLAMREEQKIKNKKVAPPLFDFSKVNFTPSQKALIEISPKIERLEDKVIAYIAQYLPICLNPSSENLILLYSRKYNTKHYNIFKSIKSAVIARKNDEELIHNVLMNVSDGYYYSISGDVYLQKEWVKLKDSLDASKIKKETKKRKPTKKASSNKIKPKKEPLSTLPTPKKEKHIQMQKLESIKDSIKRITGHNYDIYNELFFKTVRISIRHVLENSIIQKKSLFGDEENKAEDSIHEYIQKNYENPYHDWLSSENNKYVESLGFKISSIDEVIKDWAYYNKADAKQN